MFSEHTRQWLNIRYTEQKENIYIICKIFLLCKINYCYWSGRYCSGDLHGYLDVPHWRDCYVQGKYDGCYDHKEWIIAGCMFWDITLIMQMTYESLSSTEKSQNKLVVISKMIFFPGHHGVAEGSKLNLKGKEFSLQFGILNGVKRPERKPYIFLWFFSSPRHKKSLSLKNEEMEVAKPGSGREISHIFCDFPNLNHFSNSQYRLRWFIFCCDVSSAP